MHKLLTLIFVVIATTSFSQEVLLQGTCIDKDNKGIPAVKIKVNDQSTAIYSEDEGKYSFEAKVGDSIHLEFYFSNFSSEQTVVMQDFYVKSAFDVIIPPVKLNVKRKLLAP